MITTDPSPLPERIQTLGVVGLGRMGLPIATRLAAGFSVAGYDPERNAMRLARDTGLTCAANIADLVRGVDAVLVSVPDPAAVESVFLADDGVLAASKPGSIAIDLSTSTPALARRLAEQGAKRSVAVLDAPVSGGPVRAAAGTLAVMVGGDAGAISRALPALETIGDVVPVGGPGCGQATKLCNNLLTGVHMAALAESVAVAEREGLDPHVLFEVLTNGTGDSSVLRRRFPIAGVVAEAPSNNGFAPLFALSLMQKDLRLALEVAASHGLDLPMVRQAAERYEAARRRGWGDLDYSVVARVDGDSAWDSERSPNSGGAVR